MKKTLLRCVLMAALVAMVPLTAAAGELKLIMQDGRVTLNADNVSVRQILQEWARVGQTQIVNLDKLSGPNITLQLNNVPERDALDIVLRSANGYIAAPRPTPVAGAALYDRITIFMSTARPPMQVASVPPPTFQRPPQTDDDEPINVAMPPQMVSPINGQYPGVPPQLPPQFQQQLQQQLQQQQQLMQPGQQPQQPMTSPVPGALTAPRPGALPVPAYPGVPNPYQPIVTKPNGPGGPGGPGLE